MNMACLVLCSYDRRSAGRPVGGLFYMGACWLISFRRPLPHINSNGTYILVQHVCRTETSINSYQVLFLPIFLPCVRFVLFSASLAFVSSVCSLFFCPFVRFASSSSWYCFDRAEVICSLSGFTCPCCFRLISLRHALSYLIFRISFGFVSFCTVVGLIYSLGFLCCVFELGARAP